MRLPCRVMFYHHRTLRRALPRGGQCQRHPRLLFVEPAEWRACGDKHDQEQNIETFSTLHTPMG